MIVEYIRYGIPAERRAAFEEAYDKAQRVLGAAPQCVQWDLARCVEDPTQYILRIEWTSAEDHLQGFRRSPSFREFLALVGPFVGQIQEMRHYEPTAVHSVGQAK